MCMVVQQVEDRDLVGSYLSIIMLDMKVVFIQELIKSPAQYLVCCGVVFSAKAVQPSFSRLRYLKISSVELDFLPFPFFQGHRKNVLGCWKP